MNIFIGQFFEGEYPPEAADWCNSNNAYIEELESAGDVRRFQIKEIPAPTSEQLAQREYVQLRTELSKTDYVVIKIAEGSATADEYAEQLTQRKQWRARVQELEEQYPSLKG